jgi:hypothetical protein
LKIQSDLADLLADVLSVRIRSHNLHTDHQSSCHDTSQVTGYKRRLDRPSKTAATNTAAKVSQSNYPT